MNKLHYYTHYDLTTAKEMGLEVKLITDAEPNALLYEPEHRISGSKIFQKYVDTLYDLKSKKVKGAKLLLNCLWGVLTKMHKYNYVASDENRVVIHDDKVLHTLKPYGKDGDKTLVTFISQDNCFSSNYARMKPFLLAKGRRDIYEVVKPHLDHVQWIHTDGFIVNRKINIKTGDKIGDLKYEGYCANVKIENCMKVFGEFK